MSDDILNTIEVLTARARAKEAELSELKKLINGLCTEAKIELKYTDVSTVSGASLRSDQFYGQTLTAALRGYLEYRKLSGQGAASVNEIFKGIKSGGYKFETTNEDNQKIATSNALRKSSSIFHRLPTGFYGLLSWYPSAKEPAQPDQPATKKHRGRKPKKERKATPAATQEPETAPADIANGTAGTTNGTGKDGITFKEIRAVIFSQPGNFTSADIESALRSKFPSKDLPGTKVPSLVFILKKKGKLKEVSARSGKTPAVYAKA